MSMTWVLIILLILLWFRVSNQARNSQQMHKRIKTLEDEIETLKAGISQQDKDKIPRDFDAETAFRTTATESVSQAAALIQPLAPSEVVIPRDTDRKSVV